MKLERPIPRMLLAVGCSAASLLVRLLLDPVLGTRLPYATFFVSVAVSALWGGLAAGVLALILGGLSAAYFIVPPRHALSIVGSDHQLGFALYVGVASILILLAELQRRTNRRLESEARRREAAETAERLAHERFRVTLASIGDGVIATDTEARVTFLNAVAEQLTGWTASEAIGRPVEEVVAIRHESTGEVVPNPASRAIRERRIVALANHTVLIRRDGSSIPIDDSGAPIVDGSGTVVGAVLVFRDVTEKKLRESALAEQGRMIELSHDAIIMMDANRVILRWNRGAEELYGWTAEEACGKVIHDLLHSHGEHPTAEIDEALRRDGRWDGEIVHQTKDGREIVSDSRHFLVRDEFGAAAAILEINRDLTRRRQLEQELRRTAAEAEEGRRLLEAILQNVPEGLTIADAPDGRIRAVSRHGVEMTGRQLEALVNTKAAEHPVVWGVFHADGRTPAAPEELPLTRAVTRGEVVADEEWVIQKPGGEVVQILCNAAPIRDGEGRVTAGIVVWRDIGHRKRLEEKLREAAKLESIGVLAGGVAHDFNNLLTAILGNASLLTDLLAPDAPEAGYAAQICAAAERASMLTRQMLAYSGKGRFVIEKVDLSAHIRSTAALLTASIPKSVNLELDLSDTLPPIDADGGQLDQILMNLLINGAEAIGPQGGSVTVVTRARQVDETYLRLAGLDTVLRPGGFVELEVTDTGCGMNEETLRRIFDPFFTTKFTGRGLGLAAVQGIVRSHGGAIRVFSSPGRGTTFRLLFPEAASEPATREAAAPVAPVVHGTVLVVDNEEIVRMTAVNALGRLGYRVVTASHGAEAVETFERIAPDVSVVLLDMTTPGLTAEETFLRLRQTRADVPVLLSTGFSESEAARRFGAHRPSGFLQKPYTVSALAARVRSAVAD